MRISKLERESAGFASTESTTTGGIRSMDWLRARMDYLASLISGELERRWPTSSQSLVAACRHALLPTGKLFRPIMMLESTMAVGGDPKAALPAAVGAECGHAASLVHDDIIDNDDMRRGQPSVHRNFGTEEAIIAGDALIFHLFAGLAECRDTGIPDERITLALGAVARAGIDMCTGQSLEAAPGRNAGCTTEDYLTVVRLKTGAFFRGVCQCGAILGGARPDWVDAVGRYGERLGVAFQIHDDLLDYISDSLTMGKSATSDIRNRRFTLPVIYAYAAAGAQDRLRIDHAYSGSMEPDEALASMREVLWRTYGIAAAEHTARDNAHQAGEALSGLPASPSRQVLARFAELAVDRKY